MLIQHCFCTDVIIRLEESKEPDTPWNMVSLWKAIAQYITVQENAHCYALHERAKFNESIRSLHRSSVEVLTNSVNTSNGQTLLPCIFCKGNHYNDECDNKEDVLFV